MNTLNENKPPIAQSSANGATLTDVLCCFCQKPFKPWHDGFEINDSACRLCDISYQEGSEFDRDNFGDN